MSSRETLQLDKIMSGISYHLKCLPFHSVLIEDESITSTKLRFGNRHHKRVWMAASIFRIFFRIFLSMLGCWYDFTYGSHTAMSERVQFYFLISFELVSMTVQLCTLIFSREIYLLVNTFHLFDAKLVKIHRINQLEPDGIEIYIKTMIVIMFSGVALVVPSTIMYIHFEVHAGAVLKTSSYSLTILSSFIVTAVALGDTLHIFFYINLALRYCNSGFRCLELLKWRPRKQKRVRKGTDIVTIYRAHQLFHNLAMSDSKYLLCLGLIGSSIIMISTLFPLIAYYNELSIFGCLIAIGVFLISLLATKAQLQLVSHITTSSIQVPLSYLRNGYKTLSSWKRKRFRASSPLKLNIGFMTVLKPQDVFVFLVSDVVISRVVDLLIMPRHS